MYKRVVFIAVLVLLISLAVVGIALAATPRGITPDGVVTDVCPGCGVDGTFDVTNNQGTTVWSNHDATSWYSHPACPVSSYGELQVGHVVGAKPFTGGHIHVAGAVVVFPANCP